uniref:Uncharacterized protein n=1 Tax=Rhizophora mucronata TaxID=61149 RepID=A0A2P2KV77_RHIMU
MVSQALKETGGMEVRFFNFEVLGFSDFRSSSRHISFVFNYFVLSCI